MGNNSVLLNAGWPTRRISGPNFNFTFPTSFVMLAKVNNVELGLFDSNIDDATWGFSANAYKSTAGSDRMSIGIASQNKAGSVTSAVTHINDVALIHILFNTGDPTISPWLVYINNERLEIDHIFSQQPENGKFVLGSCAQGATNGSGFLQDFIIFDRVLTDAEITAQYNAAFNPENNSSFRDLILSQGASHYYPLDEKNGIVARDIVGGNDLTYIDAEKKQPGLRVAIPPSFVIPPPQGVTRYNNLRVPKDADIKSVRFVYPYDTATSYFPLSDLGISLSDIRLQAKDNEFFPLTMMVYLHSVTGQPPTFAGAVLNDLLPVDISDVIANSVVFYDLLSSDNFKIDFQGIEIPDLSQGEIIIEFFNFPYKPEVYKL